ncbi:hypothetical protein TNCT_420951 [Trichonephila clavata]|uniref:Uncharacterized protein n=1 Tax=Trichonephila clavata TaxID=2740835 RepID=A0A8X6KPL5_TRICU|nr:hypothetical protein TNCT_420951 [Trichonephila clavata]
MHTCLILSLPLMIGNNRFISYLLYQFADIYSDTVLPYAIILFYILYCYTFSQCLTNEDYWETENRQVSEKGLRIIEDVDSIFSFYVCFAYFYIASSFTKMLFVSLYAMEHSKLYSIYVHSFDFVISVGLTIGLVFMAEGVQRKWNNTREKLLKFSNSSTDDLISKQHQGISEDYKCLRPKGLEMFTVRRPLLFCLVACLITSAVNILQLPFIDI